MTSELTTAQAADLAAETREKLELELNQLVKANRLRDRWNERTLDYEIHLIDYSLAQQRLLEHAIARIAALEAESAARKGEL